MNGGQLDLDVLGLPDGYRDCTEKLATHEHLASLLDSRGMPGDAALARFLRDWDDILPVRQAHMLAAIAEIEGAA